jgi:DNA-binding transcriptional MerR regulator
MPLKLAGQTFYNISEACKMAGINRDTFLRWVRQGKFTDVEHRDRNGWRLFTEDDVRRLEARVNHIERRTTVRQDKNHVTTLEDGYSYGTSFEGGLSK